MSMWWLLVAFILGAYAGAILVGIMSMAARSDDEYQPTEPMRRRGEYPRRTRHAAPVGAHFRA